VIVKIDIPSAPSLRPGQFARIVLPGGAVTATLFIPTEAVQRFGQMERVFVRDKDLAALRLVRSGARRDEMLEILGGLSPGDQVILNSADLHEGQKITVLP
jgi:multidrug efflux pump subunit AcrA (membrane-fusion protein)